MLRYIQLIHIHIFKYATIDLMVDNLKYQLLNGGKMIQHYLCDGSVHEMVESMGEAQDNLDNVHIIASKYYSVCEDAKQSVKLGLEDYSECLEQTQSPSLFKYSWI